MKPIVKKMIESGIVDRHTTALMEKWGQIDHGSVDLVGKNDVRKATENTLEEFAEELEDIIEKDREAARETRLAVQIGEPFLATWLHLVGGTMQKGGSMVLFVDNFGNFMFPLKEEENIYPGAVFMLSDETQMVVLTKEKMYVGDQPYTVQVSAERRAG